MSFPALDSSWSETFLHDDDSDFHNSDSDSDSLDFDPSAILVDQDSESEDEKDISYGIHTENTCHLQNQMEGNLSKKVQKVLSAMESVGINLPIFLDALSWGDAECIADSKIQYARSSLLMSAEQTSWQHCAKIVLKIDYIRKCYCDCDVAGGSDVRASKFGGLGPQDVEGKVWGSIAALSSFDFDTAADVLKSVKTTWAQDSELVLLQLAKLQAGCLSFSWLIFILKMQAEAEADNSRLQAIHQLSWRLSRLSHSSSRLQPDLILK
jgi:hypothetical protein